MTAFTANPTGYLRQGCLLVSDPAKPQNSLKSFTMVSECRRRSRTRTRWNLPSRRRRRLALAMIARSSSTKSVQEGCKRRRRHEEGQEGHKESRGGGDHLMPYFFCITVRFLDSAFHGRGDRGKPEWPPSPLRLFLALIAAAAARWREAAFQKVSQLGDSPRWTATAPRTSSPRWPRSEQRTDSTCRTTSETKWLNRGPAAAKRTSRLSGRRKTFARCDSSVAIPFIILATFRPRL